ncbi:MULTISPECIES: Mfa1 family fimbria major subunit [Bacteroides]|uniref:Mfa1 family fimbria major subunit n=1 Tax=Bacteroides TaxID=816 RepID=UPI000B384CBA|nr:MULTISPECIES: Mfa1 family fimbria major subunit [Bacteroides]MBM6945375.1 Mfa1 fimbrilin C-terminal domain-containing protein [Bacteroides gallinaceum]OUO55940.1 hypothetical protein B5F78_10040 [Bacteroides sp. An279]
MKKVKYLAMLLAAGMFAACSDNLEDAGAGNAGGTTPSTTEGYVRVAINMPTTSGGMSRVNDTGEETTTGAGDDYVHLEDGIANEYKITDGIIVFFKETRTGDPLPASNPDVNATFESAYTLTLGQPQDDPTAQVTERVVTVSEAPMVDATKGEALYALVILNVPSTVTVDANTHGLTITNNGKSTVLTDKSTLSAFKEALKNQQLSTYIGDNKDKFTMLNAPLSTVAGSDALAMSNPAAKTLVPVTVYKTENEALSNDAARIYVERVVAKVTLTGFKDGKIAVKDNNGAYEGDEVALDGWLLNVTNKSTKLVRDVAGYKAATETGSWLAAATSATNNITRFAGTEVIPVNFEDTPTNYYRIYWAEDGNYSSVTNVDSEFNTYYTDQDPASGNVTPTDADWNKNTADNATDATDHALYCLENTMAVSDQKQNQTTSVVLKTTYKTKFGNQTTASAQDFFLCGESPLKYPAETNISTGTENQYVKDIVTFVRESANEVLAEGSQIGESDLSLKKTGEEITADAGIYDSLEKLKELFTLTNENDTKWDAIWNQVGTIRYYKGGINYYYAARIRHFNDAETPWNDGESYGIQHLGRYGVVRNNWYEVNVNSISGPGEPVITKPGDNPDDENEGYIRAEINVLSWAKRSQNVDL